MKLEVPSLHSDCVERHSKRVFNDRLKQLNDRPELSPEVTIRSVMLEPFEID